jgi:hypothetical protein
MAYKINKNRKGHYAFLRTDAPSPPCRKWSVWPVCMTTSCA